MDAGERSPEESAAAPEQSLAPIATPAEPTQDVRVGRTGSRGHARPVVVWLIVLAVAFVAAAAGCGVLWTALQATNASLGDLNDRIDQQQQQIDQQQDLLDEKQQFGESMDHLMQTAADFKGVPFATIVPLDEYQRLAESGWDDRNSPTAIVADIATAKADAKQLTSLRSAATKQRRTDRSGTLAESILDRRGHGFVATAYGNAKKSCKLSDAMGCVYSGQPYTVHLDRAKFAAAYTNDWARTLITDHEFAHVLQFTNPGPTATALKSFDGDVETMADCYALTMTHSWTLQDQVVVGNWIWTNTYGYGHVCGDAQRKVIRRWVSRLGFDYHSVGQ